MTISVRLNEQEEHQLAWLLQDVNEEPKGYRDQGISDIVRIAINNEWAHYNLEHYENNEIEKCDKIWLKEVKKINIT